MHACMNGAISYTKLDFLFKVKQGNVKPKKSTTMECTNPHCFHRTIKSTRGPDKLVFCKRCRPKKAMHASCAVHTSRGGYYFCDSHCKKAYVDRQEGTDDSEQSQAPPSTISDEAPSSSTTKAAPRKKQKEKPKK